MLRAALPVIGAFSLAAAIVAAVMGAPIALVIWLCLIGAALVGGILFERGRYKPHTTDTPGSDWVATGERFVDPNSGAPVTVFYQPSTGERRYVAR
jgi:chromate transport protein ChrA